MTTKTGTTYMRVTSVKGSDHSNTELVTCADSGPTERWGTVLSLEFFARKGSHRVADLVTVQVEYQEHPSVTT